MSTASALAAVRVPAAGETWTQRAADAVTGWLSRRTTRRGFLARSAVVGSALAVDTLGFALKPQSAYASVCGPGASCTSGWTVFCATINKGVNACPPGSIAAGWWKADGASLCGGRARYIIDCNATCSRCSTAGSRPGICKSTCWSCGCTCGPSNQCDQRRVCCNAFRYGQCNQQVHQVGAVQCRVVSCVPPWKIANCTTASATDNRTRDHSSPALPNAWTPIRLRYLQLGEAASPLGPSVYAEVAVPGGRAQRYVTGRISYNPGIGARALYGAIAARYTLLGAEAGVLGFPLTEVLNLSYGRAAKFQKGRVSWHPVAGAFETLGPIATRYVAAGAEGGELRFPIAPPGRPRDGIGRFSAFQYGRISWHPDLGAFLLGRYLAPRYVQTGAESGPLGYPVADQLHVASAVFAAALQHGRIVWSSTTGAVVLRDVLAEAYVRSGAEKGPLGLPVADEQAVTGGRVQRCQTGRLSSGPPGTFWTRGPITDKYVELGAEQGSLGWPVGDEQTPSTGVRRSDFEHGWISYDEASGQVTVGP